MSPISFSGYKTVLQKSTFSLFVYVNFLQKLHFSNAYSEKTKSVTPIFYNRFRCISLRTTTMQKFKQIWIYAIWYRPTLRTKQRTKIHHICLLMKCETGNQCRLISGLYIILDQLAYKDK
jgi:hypothetical protein